MGGAWSNVDFFDSLLGSKVMQGSVRGQNAKIFPMATKFGRKNPRPKCNYLLGSKDMQGSAGVSRGQPEVKLLRNALGRKNSRPKCNALMGSKVMQGSAGVN